MNNIIEKNTEKSVLNRILSLLKLDDVSIISSGESNSLTAFDNSENKYWENEEFYEFLIKEVFVYDDTGINGIDKETQDGFFRLALSRGVEFKGITIFENKSVNQFWRLKPYYPDYIVFNKVGDFYETLGENAIQAAKELDLVLTKKQNFSCCGVPAFTIDDYKSKLLEKGYKVILYDDSYIQNNSGKVSNTVISIIHGNAIDKGLQAINQYKIREFGYDADAPYGNLEDIGLAFGVNDRNETVDVTCDLVNKKISKHRSFDVPYGKQKASITLSALFDTMDELVKYISESTYDSLIG